MPSKKLGSIGQSKIVAVVVISVLSFSYIWSFHSFIAKKSATNTNLSDLNYDDPKLLEVIREKYITFPPKSLKERFLTKEVYMGSVLKFVRLLLGNQTNGFFVEAGANDGEFLSNSLHLEVFDGWTGLLVEGDPVPRAKLLNLKRNAWIANCCLSPTTKSEQLNMARHKSLIGLGNIPAYYPESLSDFQDRFQVQCFPLYSILLAIGKVDIDYLSLDLEGADLAVLQTIPFDKINIKVISAEINPKSYPEKYMKMKQLLEENG